jgi:hypothetical protein
MIGATTSGGTVLLELLAFACLAIAHKPEDLPLTTHADVSKLYASDLDATCEHQDLGTCDDCHALQVADRFA